MTREEAIRRLREILTEAVEFENSVCYVTEEDREPLEMAIQTLLQEPTSEMVHVETLRQVMWERDIAIGQLKELGYGFGQKIEPCDDAISRQAALNSLIDNTHLDGYDLAEALDAIENKEKLPPVTPKPIECDDTISRQAVLSMQYRIDDSATLSTRSVVNVDDIEDLPPVRPQLCDDAISREAVMGLIAREHTEWDDLYIDIAKLPFVMQKSGKCKNCKYFEYDSVAKVDGIPLIVAHEICNKWGDGCKTKEDGYCFLFEPKESEE